MDIKKNKPDYKHLKNFSAKRTAFKYPKKNAHRQESHLFIAEKDELPNNTPTKKGGRFKKVAVSFLAILFSGVVILGGFFMWKTYCTVQKMHALEKESPDSQVNHGSLNSTIISAKEPDRQSSGRINILLLGAAGEKKPGNNLTDTIMIMSIDTKNEKMALLSLPRDLYVKIPKTQSYTKINSLYQIGLKEQLGISLIKDSIEDITGLSIQYYFVLDFDGFTEIIDRIGGIHITSERDIFDARYPGPNYSYETFSLSKGFHVMDGATALKYARERHDDPQGDFGRAKRQQQIIQAFKNKLFSIRTLFNVATLNDILDTLGDKVRTNVTYEELESFISLSKKIDTQNINMAIIDAWRPDSLLKASHVQFGNSSAFVLIPRVGNYSEIRDAAKNIFQQEELAKRKKLIADEEASIAIINRSGDSATLLNIQNLLREKLDMKNASVIHETNPSIQDDSKVVTSSVSAKTFTVDELIKKLPASLSEDNSAYPTTKQADILIVLGKDLVPIYHHDDISLDDFNKAQDELSDDILIKTDSL